MEKHTAQILQFPAGGKGSGGAVPPTGNTPAEGAEVVQLTFPNTLEPIPAIPAAPNALRTFIAEGLGEGDMVTEMVVAMASQSDLEAGARAAIASYLRQASTQSGLSSAASRLLKESAAAIDLLSQKGTLKNAEEYHLATITAQMNIRTFTNESNCRAAELAYTALKEPTRLATVQSQGLFMEVSLKPEASREELGKAIQSNLARATVQHIVERARTEDAHLSLSELLARSQER